MKAVLEEWSKESLSQWQMEEKRKKDKIVTSVKTDLEESFMHQGEQQFIPGKCSLLSFANSWLWIDLVIDQSDCFGESYSVWIAKKKKKACLNKQSLYASCHYMSLRPWDIWRPVSQGTEHSGSQIFLGQSSHLVGWFVYISSIVSYLWYLFIFLSYLKGS